MSTKPQQRQKKTPKANSNGGGAKKPAVDKSWKRTFISNQTSAANGQDDDEEGEMCVICAETIKIQAVSKCNHPTCHKCTLRQRALYEKNACVVCRTENDISIFTEDVGKPYIELVVIEECIVKYGIYFTSERAYQEVSFLLSYSCQHCEFVGNNFRSLNDHVRQVHELQTCTMCAGQKNQFPALIKTYTAKQIQTHCLTGDVDGFTGHPACKYCRGKRFYSNDELNAHMKQDHEKCHVCEKIDPATPQYFKDFDSLNTHFSSAHFKCPVPSCLEKKFIVFEDQFELSTHMASEHSNIFGSNNVLSTSGGGPRYRSQLSTFPGAVSTPSSSGGRMANRNDGEPQDTLETKRKRLEERARHYLNYSAEDFKTFLDINKEFKFGRLSATELKRSYERLFSQKNKQHTGGDNDIYLLIYELAHLFHKSSAEYTELLAMYNQNERIVKQDEEFPALPGSESSLNLGGSWSGNKKKQNKPQEDFPALPGAQTAPKYAPVNTTVRYKTLSKPAPSVVKINKAPAQASPIKLTYLDNKSKSKPSSSSNVKANSSAPAKKINEELFPSLPTASRKKVIVPRVNPIPKGSGVWGSATVGTSATVNSDWPGLGGGGSGSGSSSGMNSMSDLNDSLPIIETTKKGKKKGKQILFQMGGR
ncbi:hypothetical protein WICPIJ_002915 [Wickerhamomyces pijperi]|uniref:RING-type E3 ubiquitin transferase n=1 Tax=Wickerhamomyces pijperi TaxID=599730 RepID=A0A9P8QAX4_WICPI|nr:hypothetical protein WICPIJ_002915 [Wickerhamomyces pijperi]